MRTASTPSAAGVPVASAWVCVASTTASEGVSEDGGTPQLMRAGSTEDSVTAKGSLKFMRPPVAQDVSAAQGVTST
ncbi:hypothetical protein GCM10012319_19300 [Comamonas sp. KCTC 72670]|nr:hypothetical protein GCM10012319_19300 [Comamonas sp. KCTC 72670]